MVTVTDPGGVDKVNRYDADPDLEALDYLDGDDEYDHAEPDDAWALEQAEIRYERWIDGVA